LRERREDIPALVNFLAAKAATAMHKETPAVSDQAMALLRNHPFWGNIRELKAYIVDAVARCEFGVITENLIAERLTGRVAGKTGTAGDPTSLTGLFGGHFPTLEELMEYAVGEALAAAENNQSQASRLLGISRQALHKRLKKKSS
ncbi:MAG: Two component, sigma54 specific, transcriptional regulator, Fis family, partial [uncultured bacterium]